MKKIFVATDFSEVSINALKYAYELASQFQASVHIMNVYESPLFYTSDMPYVAIEAADKLAKSDAENKMKNIRLLVSDNFPEIKSEFITQSGISVETITEAVENTKADLLVTGATGSGVIERTLIGSTTTSLINNSKCPILIVPEDAKFKGINTLVYATDLNDDNINAANNLVSFATTLNAQLVFLFVDHDIHSDSEKISNEMAEKISKHVKYSKTAGYVCNDADIMHGISTFIHKNKTDMIAMFTHHRTFPKILWDKSIAQKFSYHPEVPLLVLSKES